MFAAKNCVWPHLQWHHLTDNATEMKSIQLHDSIMMASPWDSISYVYITLNLYFPFHFFISASVPPFHPLHLYFCLRIFIFFFVPPFLPLYLYFCVCTSSSTSVLSQLEQTMKNKLKNYISCVGEGDKECSRRWRRIYSAMVGSGRLFWGSSSRRVSSLTTVEAALHLVQIWSPFILFFISKSNIVNVLHLF